jgi:putative membrane protein
MSQQTPNSSDPRVNLAHGRTHMAGFRTQLALDRTTLSWVRTTISIGGFGFGTVGFFRTLHEKLPSPESARLHAGAIHFGTVLVMLGIVSTMLVTVSHWLTLRRLLRGESPVLRQWPLSITVAMLLAIVGLAGLWALIF